MATAEELITENIDLWTGAIKRKSGVGRGKGSSKKVELYGVKKLRELILEMAVRGLLVPQDASDEPASVLLERIAAEKDQLIKSGKVKKQKKLPPVSDEEKAFLLPTGWTWTRLNNSYDVRDGTHNTPKYFDQGYPLITSKNISSGVLDFSDIKFISEEDHKKIKERSEVESDDILFAMIGSIGNPVIVDTDREFSIKNVALFKPYSKDLSSPNFLLMFLKFAENVFRLQATGAVQSFVSLGKIRGFPLGLPPLKEQHRIVAKVDELMALCDQLEQQTEANISAHQTLVETLLEAITRSDSSANSAESIELLFANFDSLFITEESVDQLKQAILQLAVMGKLVPQDPSDEPASVLLEKIAAEKEKLVKEKKIKKQKALPPIGDEEKPFELPVGWCFTRFDDICTWVTSGSTPPKSEFNDEKGVPYLKVYNIRNQKVDFEYKSQFVNQKYHKEKLKRSILFPGDVVMNIVGPPLGKVAIIPNTYPEWNCNQAIVFFRSIEQRMSNYLYTFLTAKTFLDHIELIGTAGQDNISVTKSRMIVLPVPPLAEQDRIVSRVEELLRLCDQLKDQLNTVQVTQLHLADAVTEQAIA